MPPFDYPDWLKKHLQSLPLAEVRYFNTISSTNDHCLQWASAGGSDLALAIADHQSAGRGRNDRKWVTNPGAALAFSLLLRPRAHEQSLLPFFSPLGAISIRAALEHSYNIRAEIKWPNDVLVSHKKLAGILVENAWENSVIKTIVVGIGINITPAALPPENKLLFPATCVESETDRPVDRWQLLAEVLEELLHWRSKLGSVEFFSEWSSHLAFRGEKVLISGNQTDDMLGELIGIDEEGNLILEVGHGQREKVIVGDVRLRAV
jgi:BirA family biotin operon repressor/biotin-[acetyl-CoA-carboxylase] ligase